MPDERPKSLSRHGVDILSGLRRPAEPLSAPMRPPGLPLLSWEVEARITQTPSLNQAWVITVNGGSPRGRSSPREGTKALERGHGDSSKCHRCI